MVLELWKSLRKVKEQISVNLCTSWKSVNSMSHCAEYMKKIIRTLLFDRINCAMTLYQQSDIQMGSEIERENE